MHHEFFQHFQHGAERKPHKALRVGKWVVLGLALATVFALLFGFVVVWLWNALMPGIFGLGKIGYWQAVGLLILAKIFFGGEHHGPQRHINKRHHHKAVCYDSRENAPISDIPEEQYEAYKHYWEERGKAAFEAYVKEQFEKQPSEEI